MQDTVSVPLGMSRSTKKATQPPRRTPSAWGGAPAGPRLKQYKTPATGLRAERIPYGLLSPQHLEVQLGPLTKEMQPRWDRSECEVGSVPRVAFPGPYGPGF